jgi:hypothetical protein
MKICGNSFNETTVFFNTFPTTHLLQADLVYTLKWCKKWNTPFLYVLNTRFVEMIMVAFKLHRLLDPLPLILLDDLTQQMYRNAPMFYALTPTIVYLFHFHFMCTCKLLFNILNCIRKTSWESGKETKDGKNKEIFKIILTDNMTLFKDKEVG